MSRRAWGKVNAGVFFKLDLQSHQEELRQEHQAYVPMPRRPGALFVMIQSELGFVFLETSFNRPARAADPHQLTQRGLFEERCSTRI
jgi:hypothetical protein